MWLQDSCAMPSADRTHRGTVQLATVTKEGLPAVRTVVFRGWVPMKPGSQEGGAGGSAVAAGLADIGAAPAQAAGAASEAGLL